MKRFKIFFYPIYLLIAVVLLYYSIDILTHQEAYMEKVSDFATLRKLPEYMLIAIIITCVLMVIEFAIENVHLYRWKQRAHASEQEIMKLKSRLYDEGQPAAGVPKLKAEHDAEEEEYLGFNEEEEKD